jgi:molybdopterin/thiamine biosynthesis adenylyltransferase
MLNQNELIRYSRQLVIPDFGGEGQNKLKNARVTIIGIGGLGCFSSMSLTAAGIGNLKLVDFDIVEQSDLNREILFGQEDIREKKVFVAQNKLSRLNPFVQITPVYDEVVEENAIQIIEGSQIVVDGTDNLPSRLIINSACVKLRIPLIFAGISRFRGMLTTIIPGQTPCLACFNLEGTGTGCMGVVAPTPAILANIQVLETIKILTGHKPAMAGKLLLFNGDSYKFRIYDIQRNENCTVCSGVLPGKSDK